MLQSILDDYDWEKYDNRKIRGPVDASKFSCQEPWEVNHLKKVLMKHLQGKTEEQIADAIDACCKQVSAPRPRKEFVQCVIQRLS